MSERRDRKLKAKILIVDDEAIVRDILNRILTNEGYRIICAEGGGTAIKNIKEEKFNLVLLDLKMTGISGIDVLREIRKRDKRTPVILISGYLNSGSVNEANKLGIFGYIEKPFDIDNVINKVKEALGTAG